jgi:hypothetical protein
MTTPVKSLIPLKDSSKDCEITYTGKYTGILDQEEQVSSLIYISPLFSNPIEMATVPMQMVVLMKY